MKIQIKRARVYIRTLRDSNNNNNIMRLALEKLALTNNMAAQGLGPYWSFLCSTPRTLHIMTRRPRSFRVVTWVRPPS